MLGIVKAGDEQFPSRAMLHALGLFVTCVIVQLLPLPDKLIIWLSPVRNGVDFNELSARASMTAVSIHANGIQSVLSIAPSRSFLGFVFLSVIVKLFYGSVRVIYA